MDAPTASTDMATFLQMLTSGLTSILSGVTSVCTTIVSTPFLLFTTIFLFVGGFCGSLPYPIVFVEFPR